MSVLDVNSVCELLRIAWKESHPGTATAHEEGGFILRDVNGALDVERWPVGSQNRISVPAHPHGKRGDRTIVATFHTHPNAGADFQQEPSLTDMRGVRDDPGLGHTEYEGEYVIASELIYRISRSGEIETV